MICPKCLGIRLVPNGRNLVFPDGVVEYGYDVIFCDYCEGEGNIYCCEGDQEQPEPKLGATKKKA